MVKNNGAAVSDPHGDDVVSRSVTNITNLGLSAGANPTNEAIVFVAS
jgi:hypothetical protein